MALIMNKPPSHIICLAMCPCDGTVNCGEAFEQFVARAPEILECYAQTGDADVIMKIRVRDLDALRDFLDQLLRATGGLASLRSSIVLKTLKEGNNLSV